jgi:hypothetical protein
MATARVPTTSPPAHLLVGQTVHYREGDHCWAAAIVESGPDEQAQLFLFPLPPSFPMPATPGTFVRHDAGRRDATWHRLGECRDDVPESAAELDTRAARNRRGGRRRATAR